MNSPLSGALKGLGDWSAYIEVVMVIWKEIRNDDS